MIIALIGHRGSGKTSLLSRLPTYYNPEEILCYDLDRKIETRAQKSVSAIFVEDGEQAFRKLESEAWQSIYQAHKTDSRFIYVAFGAGFLGNIPKDVWTVWIRRATDHDGRIFLSRPRLDIERSRYDEYMDRFAEREERYRSLADECFIIPEGFTEPNEIERFYFTGAGGFNVGGVLTLPPGKRKLSKFIRKRKAWRLDYFELRDDWLNKSEVETAAQEIPHESILLALRKDGEPADASHFESATKDWAMELGKPDDEFDVVSSHERGGNGAEDLQETIKRLENATGANTIRKLAVMIESLDELLLGHKWWKKDPDKNVFLPRSSDGRWQWYRAFYGRHARLAFFREDEGSSLDQPLLFDWLRTRISDPLKGFAAILGKPVDHSLTPFEQSDFFERGFQMPVLRIPLSETEITRENMMSLAELGLRAAAVTSPLKRAMFSVCDRATEMASEFESVNTIFFDESDRQWLGENTDAQALSDWFNELKIKENAVVWGGGGLLLALKNLLPNAFFYSARERRPREFSKSFTANSSCDLIWAGLASLQNGSVPTEWPVDRVIDLSYREDSPAREIALEKKAEYVSGIRFFKLQAALQRRWWQPLLEHRPRKIV